MSENFIKICIWSSQCLFRSSPCSQDQDHTLKPDTQVPPSLISARASLLPSPPFPHHYPSRPSKPDASSKIGQDPSLTSGPLFKLPSLSSYPTSLVAWLSHPSGLSKSPALFPHGSKGCHSQYVPATLAPMTALITQWHQHLSAFPTGLLICSWCELCLVSHYVLNV